MFPYDEVVNSNNVLLFEIIDFNLVQPCATRRRHVGGLHGLAWAYLRLDGAEITTRLQLYDYQVLSTLARYQARARGLAPPPAPVASKVPAVYLHYLNKRRTFYKSSLLVHIQPVSRPRDFKVYRRPAHPNEMEAIDNSLAMSSQLELSSVISTKEIAQDFRSLCARSRSRRSCELCIMPDKLLCRIDAGVRGALTLRFSPKGRILAVTAIESLFWVIRLYDATGFAGDVPSAAATAASFGVQVDHDAKGAILLADLDAHHGVIHDICFTNDERYLLSASADGLAKVWDLGALAALPDCIRPKFRPHILCIFQVGISHKIYAAAFVTASACDRTIKLGRSQLRKPPYTSQAVAKVTDERQLSMCPFVLTGSCHGAIGHWNPQTCTSGGLLGGKPAHSGHVNCIEVDWHGGRVYSGDSLGVVIAWRKDGDGDCLDHFSKIRNIRVAELNHKPVVSMQLHPTLRRAHLLVQAGTLRLVDLTTGRVVSCYKGNLVRNALVRAEFSPDGQTVIAGSEDGRVYAWDAKSSKLLATPRSYVRCNAPICDISWHPTQHVIACTCLGGENPVLLYCAARTNI